MAQYRKKPVTVEAVQWFKRGDHPAVECSYYRNGVGFLGEYEISPGDWIITENGQHTVCKPDIFEATYEAVAEEIAPGIHAICQTHEEAAAQR